MRLPYRTVRGEFLVGGELWLELSCGHRMRTASAVHATRYVPAHRQRCITCADQIGGSEGETRIVGGTKYFKWRGEWRVWK